jgi:hypothetical protein
MSRSLVKIKKGCQNHWRATTTKEKTPCHSSPGRVFPFAVSFFLAIRYWYFLVPVGRVTISNNNNKQLLRHHHYYHTTSTGAAAAPVICPVQQETYNELERHQAKNVHDELSPRFVKLPILHVFPCQGKVYQALPLMSIVTLLVKTKLA